MPAPWCCLCDSPCSEPRQAPDKYLSAEQSRAVPRAIAQQADRREAERRQRGLSRTQEPSSASLLAALGQGTHLGFGRRWLPAGVSRQGEGCGGAEQHESSCRPGQSLLWQHKVPGGLRAALTAPAPSEEQPTTQLPVPAACLSALDLPLDLRPVDTSRSGGSIGPNDFIPFLTNALSCRVASGPRTQQMLKREAEGWPKAPPWAVLGQQVNFGTITLQYDRAHLPPCPC